MDFSQYYVAGVIAVMTVFLGVLTFVTIWSRGAR